MFIQTSNFHVFISDIPFSTFSIGIYVIVELLTKYTEYTNYTERGKKLSSKSFFNDLEEKNKSIENGTTG